MMDETEKIVQLKSKVLQLEGELSSTKAELQKTKRKLTLIEQKYEKSESYNEDLRNEIKKLSSPLHEYKKSASLKNDKSTHVDETEFSTTEPLNNDLNNGYTCHDDDQTLIAGVNDEGSHDSIEDCTEAPSLAESLKEAAESATHQSGFVYDEQYGMYYDYNTGYYYDPKKCLYYDPHSGINYNFNQRTNEYEFHSQIDLAQFNHQGEGQSATSDPMEVSNGEISKRKRKEDQTKHEEGLVDITEALSKLNIQKIRENALATSAIHYPPCIRVIVQKSDTLDEGALFIVPCTGATIGRENNMGHTILVPDMNVSKMHCAITYDEGARHYVIKDHASQNGTFVNSARISEVKVMSEPYPVKHGDIVDIGGTSLLCHIHPGTETCDYCEPGQIQAQLAKQEVKDVVILSKEEKEKQRRKELKNIRKKYGLQNAPYENSGKSQQNSSYSDKAEQRRRTVGSDNPYQKDDMPASVDVAISTSNVGHKLMEKMGWKSGQSLGHGDVGIKEPIKVNIRSNQQAGLGSAHSYEHSIDNPHQAKKAQKWVNVQKRYQAVQSRGSPTSKPLTDIFDLPKGNAMKPKEKGPIFVKGTKECGQSGNTSEPKPLTDIFDLPKVNAMEPKQKGSIFVKVNQEGVDTSKNDETTGKKKTLLTSEKIFEDVP